MRKAKRRGNHYGQWRQPILVPRRIDGTPFPEKLLLDKAANLPAGRRERPLSPKPAVLAKEAGFRIGRQRDEIRGLADGAGPMTWDMPPRGGGRGGSRREGHLSRQRAAVLGRGAVPGLHAPQGRFTHQRDDACFQAMRICRSSRKGEVPSSKAGPPPATTPNERQPSPRRQVSCRLIQHGRLPRRSRT